MSNIKTQIPRRLSHKQSVVKNRGADRFDYSLNYKTLNLRDHPELYKVGRGEEGVFSVEPFKSEILPYWRFKTPEIASKSANDLLAKFN